VRTERNSSTPQYRRLDTTTASATRALLREELARTADNFAPGLGCGGSLAPVGKQAKYRLMNNVLPEGDVKDAVLKFHFSYYIPLQVVDSNIHLIHPPSER
jgi:hypothetical protein